MSVAHTDDGRHIDASIGVLSGEGAQIEVESPEHAYPTTRAVSARVPVRDVDPTYYDEPVLKETPWAWAIPVYFYVGGLAGAASALAASAQALDRRGLGRMIQRAHRVAALGEVVSGGLLIQDLGRPARFLYMLRVFRPTSPMSVGSWVLSASGACSSVAVLCWGRRGVLGSIGAVAGAAAGPLGLALAGYTAVLLAGTAVPVWQGARRTLPPLFLGSAMASVGSLLDLGPLSRRERVVARSYGLIGKTVALAGAALLELEVGQVPRVALPLHTGASGTLWQLARGLTGASLLLSLLPGHGSRGRRVASGLLGTAGAMSLRWAIFQAGKSSARDPRATFRQQRAATSGRTRAECDESMGSRPFVSTRS